MLLRQHGGDVVVEKERTIVVVEPLRLEGQANGTVSYTPGSNTPVIWYLGENQSETTEPVEPKRPLFIPIDSIIKRLERLETLAFPRQNPDASDVRRYNLESLRQTEWYQRHQNDGPI
ncbi:MAG: hypothetical protein RBU37_27980, partial [Myxococcota bacterium]|jgi:hypothetical protein|nr:hypothetical protein [Myxococcota bacterium]